MSNVAQFSPNINTLGEADVSIDLENSNDSRNVVPISIHTVVTTDYHDREALQLSCGDELDFGYCFTNSEKERELTLRNITERLMFVNLTTSSRDEATFRLKEAQVEEPAGKEGLSMLEENDEDGSQTEGGGSALAHESDAIGSDTDGYSEKEGGSQVRFCIQNDEFCIKKNEFCIKNDEFCI